MSAGFCPSMGLMWSRGREPSSLSGSAQGSVSARTSRDADLHFMLVPDDALPRRLSCAGHLPGPGHAFSPFTSGHGAHRAED